MIRKAKRFAVLLLGTLLMPAFLIVAVVVALVSRFAASKPSPRLFWGSDPIINYSYWSQAMRAANFSSETFVTTYYSINSRTDWNRVLSEEYPWLPTIVRRFLAFLEVLARYDVVFTSFNGVFIGNQEFWRIQAPLLKIAKKKIVVLSYGSDAYVYRTVADPSLLNGLLSSYPEAARHQREIADRVDYWCRHADVVIPGFMGPDGIGRWDVVLGSALSLDLDIWKVGTRSNANDGHTGPVIVCHAPNHRGFKGTEFVVDAVRQLREEGLNVELRLLEKLPNQTVRTILRDEADILVEQLVFTGHGINALEGMASGLPVVSNLESESLLAPFRRWSFLSECPLVSASPETVADVLRRLVTDTRLRADLGQAGRQYVEKYHGLKSSVYLFTNVLDYLAGRRDSLMNLYHPLLGEYPRRSPRVESPLTLNKIPSMNLVKAVLRDSAIYGGADFLSKLVAFASFPFIAAALTPAGFGSLDLILSSTTLIGVLANCGINNSLQRFYWDHETLVEQRPALVSSGAAMLLVFECAAAIVGAVVFLAIKARAPDIVAQVGWLGAAAALVMMVATQASQYLLDVVRLHQAPWRFFGVSLVTRVALALAGVATVVGLRLGLDAMLVAQSVVAVAALPLAAWAVSRDLTASFDWRRAKQIFSFGYPFIFASVAFWLLGSIDRWMLAAFSSIEEVGIYSAAYRYASIALFASAAFGQAWSPMAMKIRMEHPQSYRSIYADVLLLLASAMLVMGTAIAVLAPQIISLTMPVEYQRAVAPLAVLSLGVVLQSTIQVTAIGISIEKKTGLFARLSWLTAAVNALLNVVLVPRFGALGAAWGTTIAYLFLTCGYLYFTQRLHPLPLSWWRLAVLGALWLGVAVFAGGHGGGWFGSGWYLSVLVLIVVSVSGLLLLVRGTGRLHRAV